MKKVLSFAAIASAFAISCTKAENDLMDPSAGRNVIQAVIEDDTRSSVTDGGTFNWTSGDKITLVGEYNSRATYNYDSGNNFSLEGSSSVTNPTVAYYPASSEHEEGKFFLATSYTYEDGVSTNAAMIATPPTQGDTYAFRHLGGLMRFNVKNVPVGAESFSFTADGKKITGDFTIGDGIIETVASETDNTVTTVTINFTELTVARDMTFYVPLPVGEYGNYTVAFTFNGNQESKSHTSENVTNTINRKTLLLMPTFSFDGTGNLVKGNAPAGVIDLEEGDKSADIDDSDGDGAEVVVVPGDDEEDAAYVATLNYTSAAGGTSTLSLSDGSADNTASGESEGNVVVNAALESGDPATVASLDIDMPTMTVTLQAPAGKTVTYNTVTATTAQNTLIIGKGVTVKNLIVEGGNLRVYGTIETISRADGNNEGITYIIPEEGANIPSGLSDKFKLVSAGELDLIMAIEDENTSIYQLKADVALKNPLTIPTGKTLTLDLNDKTLSYESGTMGESMLTNNGTLTIKNGTVTYTYTGEADATYSKGNYAINNSGTLTIDANINAVAGTVGQKFSHAFYAIQTSGKTVINGGKILNNTNIAIRQWVGSETQSSDITVNGGEIKGLRAIWIQLPNSDTSKAPLANLTVKDGELRGTAIDGTQDSGNVLAIYATSQGNQMKNVQINIEGGDLYGDLHLTGGRKGAKVDVEKVTITGGTFHAGDNAPDVYSVCSWADDALAAQSITITGGTFAHLYPLKYMEGDNGNINVSLTKDLIVGDTEDDDMDGPIVVPAGNTVTLDLNGQTISQTSDTPVSMITNNGALTIKDSSTNGSGKIEFTFNGTVNNNIAANAISNRGTLVVKGGVISNTGTGNQIGYAIDNYNGSTLTVDGGEISASGSSYYDGIRLFCGSNETTVTVNNGEISTIWAQNPTANKATEVNGTVIINGGTVGTIYYENYTTVKVKSGLTPTVSPYGAGSDNTTTTEDSEYTVYSFVHNN